MEIGSITSMLNGRRSSGAVNYVSAGGTSFSHIQFQRCDFLGILSPIANLVKQESSSIAPKEPREWETLAQQGIFNVDSDKLIVVDPSYDSGLEIDNVLAGSWGWNQKIQNGYVAQIIAFNKDYTSNDESIRTDWIIPEGTYRKDDDEENNVNQLDEEELEGGWIASKIGVGVDSGLAGIFDSAHFRDDSVFEPEPNKRGFDVNFTFEFEKSRWVRTVMKMCQDNDYPNSLPIPYGIISSSGMGDGCYACLFKRSEHGKVIAVKIVFLENDHKKSRF